MEAWANATVLAPYLEEIRTQRNHEANIREEYLQRSLNVLIAEQESKIITYMVEEEKQPDSNYDIGLRTLEEVKEKYEARLAMRMEESGRMRALGADPPRVVGVCAYVPMPVGLADDVGAAGPRHGGCRDGGRDGLRGRARPRPAGCLARQPRLRHQVARGDRSSGTSR